MSITKKMTTYLNENYKINEETKVTLAQMKSDIKKAKTKLKNKKPYENFGQKEISRIRNKYMPLQLDHFSDYNNLMNEFIDWCANVELSESCNKRNKKKINEDFDFEKENKDLYNKFVKIAKKSGLRIAKSGVNFIDFEKAYDDYTLEVEVDVDDFDKYDIEITFESIVYLPSGDAYDYEYFDNLEAAIAWGEKLISPRMLLLRKIKNLIDKSGVKDITSEELENLID